jgi:hypothetical protein
MIGCRRSPNQSNFGYSQQIGNVGNTSLGALDE